MTIPTNKLGILIAEIDSGGALRSAGDRVILGARSSKTEQEWVVRQKIAECTARISETVHDNHGIIARRTAESVFSTFPHAQNALSAAISILQIQDEHTRSAKEQTNSAPLGLRLGLTYGKMIVDAGHLSGDAISIAEQLAGRANSGQIYAAESIVNALGDTVRGRVKSLGTVNLNDIQSDTELFELQWNKVERESLDAQIEPPAPSAAEAPPSDPRLSVQNRGKEIILGAKRPSVTFVSGKNKDPHAKIERREDAFFLVNLRPTGTLVRIGDVISLCRDDLMLEEDGAITLGQGFREGSPEVISFSRLP